MGGMGGHRGLGGGLGEGQSLEGFETRFCCSCCVRITSTGLAGADGVGRRALGMLGCKAKTRFQV